MQIEPPSDAPWGDEISSNYNKQHYGSGPSIPQCGLISVPYTVLRGRVGEHVSILAALGDVDRNALSKNRSSDEFNRRDYLPPASAPYLYLCFSSTNRQNSQAIADQSAFRSHTTANKMAYRQNTAEITRRKQQASRS